MITPQPNFYLGVVTKILDPDKYEIEIEIPGVTKEAKAYPFRGEVDEPKPEDLVLVLGLDPVWGSCYFYQKLKENNFIGFRSRGKKLQITKKEIEIGIFRKYNEKDQVTPPPYDEDNPSPGHDDGPECSSYIKIDEDGNLTVYMEKDATITVDGNTTLICPHVKITHNGDGELEVHGKVVPDPTGPFNCIPICPVTKQPHAGWLVQNT